jgi:exodeoxyribonuclease VII small subunit
MPKVKPPADADQTTSLPLPNTYEAALQELETLVQQLESGQLPLDQLLSHYQRGSALLAFCRDRLQAVEQQIQVLDGGTLKPWGGA